MTDDDLHAIRRAIAEEERERAEAERREREERRVLNTPLSYEPIDWTRYDSTTQMDPRVFSAWCDMNPRPQLGPVKVAAPSPAPAPQPPKGPRLTKELLEKLGDATGRGIAHAVNERIAPLERELADVTARLQRIESALITRGLQTAEPLDIPPAFRLSLGSSGH